MPRIKKASSLLKLNKTHHKTANRANKRKRKNRPSQVEETQQEVPEDAAIQIEDSVETESKFLSEQDTDAGLSNHRSSTSPKTSNGFESFPPQSNGKVEHVFISERDTSMIFNRLGYSEDVLSTLPNRTWAIHCVEVPQKRIVVSSMIMHNPHGTGLEPLYIKQIVFDEKLNFDLFLINSRLVLKDKPSTIATMHDFEDLVDYVESLKICNGGPNVSQYSNVNPECAYKDPLNKWRHNLCSLEISGGEVCESCASLDEILRRHVQRSKPSVKLRNSILLPKRKQRSRD